MPYKTIEELPEEVKSLPDHAQEIWMAAFNSAWEEYEGDEEKCFAVAWAAVKEKYEQDEEGKWRLKTPEEKPKHSEENSAIINVDARLRSSIGEGDEAGYKWRVQIINFGPDRQGNIYWDPNVIRSAISLYNGAKVFALSEAQHQAHPHPYGKSVRDLVGWIEEVKENETGLEGTFHILKSAKWLKEMIVDSFERGNPDLIGLSVDVGGKFGTKIVDGKRMKTPVEISNVMVDVVYEPAAGGRFLRLAAALKNEKEEEKMEEQVFKDELERVKKTAEDLRVLACSLTLKDELRDSGLSDLSQAKIRKQFDGKIFETEALRAAIREEKEYVDKLTGSGSVKGAGDVKVVKDEMDLKLQMLEDFWERKVHSFKACYVGITGDEKITGRIDQAVRLRGSLMTTSWAEIFGDSVTRKMVKEYVEAGLDDWRKIVDVVPISDFRTQRRVRFGGYGNLPTVAQGGPYTALTSPGDEEATYAAIKRGGTEDITIEMIKNDDVGAIRRIPQRLGRAAARTIYEFVFDFIATNPVIYDSVNLFHATHGNLGSAPLSSTSLYDGRTRMIKQAEMSSGKRLGLLPKYILVPPELAKTAWDLITAPDLGQYQPTAPDFIKKWRLEMIEVVYWTDPNNWYLSANPADCPTIEIGFIDGEENPELFVQDLPTVGSMFNNDKLTYKIRHVYGGAVIDYRGLDGSIVA